MTTFERELEEIGDLKVRITYWNGRFGNDLEAQVNWNNNTPQFPDFPDQWRALRFRIAAFWMCFGVAMLWLVTR